jgi:hypothetical protein
MKEQIQLTLRNLEDFADRLIAFSPRFVIGLGLFIIGWIIARILRSGLIRLLIFMRFDALLERAGLNDLLLRGGIKKTAVETFAGLCYWFFMLVLSLAILFSFGVEAAQELFNHVLAFVPNVLVAAFVLIFGSLLAKFVRGTVYTYLTAIRISGADFLSRIAHTIAMALVIFMTLQQLSIGGQVLVSAFEIAFGGLCLAFGLAFGLAGKEWATQILERMWRHSR